MPADSPKILVVEDDKVMVDILVFNLTLAGFGVTVARSGRQAIEEIERHLFDLIITDYRVPGMNGKTFVFAYVRMNDMLACPSFSIRDCKWMCSK